MVDVAWIPYFLDWILEFWKINWTQDAALQQPTRRLWPTLHSLLTYPNILLRRYHPPPPPNLVYPPPPNPLPPLPPPPKSKLQPFNRLPPLQNPPKLLFQHCLPYLLYLNNLQYPHANPRNCSVGTHPFRHLSFTIRLRRASYWRIAALYRGIARQSEGMADCEWDSMDWRSGDVCSKGCGVE